MSKKKSSKAGRHDREPELPKFGGFKPLAAGLGELKAKLDAEVEAERARREEAARAGRRPPPPAPPPRPARRTERPSAANDPEDELTFHRMMSGVVPLEGREGKGSRVPIAGNTRDAAARMKPADLRAKAREEATAVLDHLHHLVDDAVRFEVTDDGNRVEGRRVDVPPSLLRELRHGALPIDGRLDLHGLGAADARERLLEFLKAQRARGERCVLVIHGKGEHSVSARGVLRGEIAAWLSQGRAREHVAAFATACKDDGGEGAVYVALRR